MKKRNLFKMFVVVVLAVFGVLNVNAANTYVDASTCEGGRVYTNYYFFLDASPKMTEDYKTIGYYKNSVMNTRLQNIVNRYGIFSEEFTRVANRAYGVVPIDTYNTGKTISVNGIGLRTFYNMIVAGGVRTDGNNTYLIEHNWSKVQNQIVKEENTKSISFSYNDISRMMNATVMLRQYPTISPIFNLNDSDHPVQIQINRKYSQSNSSYANVVPIKLLADDNLSTWDAYLQPALMYVQYCVKGSSNSLELLHYEPNAGTDVVKEMPSDQYFVTGDVTTISSKTPVRPGYTFLGWSNRADSTVPSSLLTPGSRVGSSMTIYAVWKKNEVGIYTIEYKPNTTDTVSNMPDNTIFYLGETTKIASNIPVRSGYTFLGWSTISGATEAQDKYKSGSPYTDNKNLVLYAVWKKNETNTYSVVYRPNTTDTVSNMPAGVTKNVGETMNISSDIPVRSGYTFLGWSTISGATTIEEKYNAGSKYTDGKDLILYAVWKKKSSDNLPDNPGTGVEEYIIPFSGAITAAFAGLKLLKKKKSFLQF